MTRAFALTPDELHDYLSHRQEQWPVAMTAGSTHDTKRGEDVRARITALSEVPELWARSLDRLLELVPVPDAGLANLLWQAVLGAWPASADRLHAYAEKAMREASEHTTWIDPDAGYEAAMHACVPLRTRRPGARGPRRGAGSRRPAGWSNALGARIVSLTAPGCARRLPGQRAVGAEPGRPRQPASGGLRAARGGARAGPLG